uniref:Uncharacterized protein n=1 Tax=Cacopsylla melanoneura TaxID=428564 RepID=A0A8D8XIU2_9HEMI
MITNLRNKFRAQKEETWQTSNWKKSFEMNRQKSVRGREKRKRRRKRKREVEEFEKVMEEEKDGDLWRMRKKRILTPTHVNFTLFVFLFLVHGLQLVIRLNYEYLLSPVCKQ